MRLCVKRKKNYKIKVCAFLLLDQDRVINHGGVSHHIVDPLTSHMSARGSYE